MTVNQVSYAQLLESRRHNKVTESQTDRNLTETERSHQVDEYERGRHNLATETETNRSNMAREEETALHDRTTETESARHNKESETIDSAKVSETERHDLATEAQAVNELEEKTTANYRSWLVNARSNVNDAKKIANDYEIALAKLDNELTKLQQDKEHYSNQDQVAAYRAQVEKAKLDLETSLASYTKAEKTATTWEKYSNVVRNVASSFSSITKGISDLINIVASKEPKLEWIDLPG